MLVWFFNSTNFYVFFFSSVAGGAVSLVDPDSTGLNPSWRNALSEVYIFVLWPEGSTTDIIFERIGQLERATLIIDELTTDSGSYLNEVKEHNRLHLKQMSNITVSSFVGFFA